jgi:uncharacterized LabA/DUF88 family protein
MEESSLKGDVTEMNLYKGARVGVLVDVQNVFYAARDQFSHKLDFVKLLHQAVDGRSLIKAVAYCVTCPGTDPRKFHDSLRSHGYEIREKMLKIISEGVTKGDWDIGITIDAINIAPSVDVIVLVSGDGDFVDLVNYLKAVGKRVEAVCFHGATAAELLDVVDSYTWVDGSMLLKKPSDYYESCIPDQMSQAALDLPK